MNTKFKNELPLLALVLIPFLYLAYIWNSLPERVPIHWDASGHVNGWGNKLSLLMIPVLLPLLMYILFPVILMIDPKKKLEGMGSKYHQLRLWLVLCLSAMATYIIYCAKAGALMSPNSLFFLIGLLFAILGNYFPSLKANYFIGIRTPWTLESETVWKKTHQLAARLWFPGGILIMALALLIADPKTMNSIFLVITAILVVVPIGYSFYVSRKEDRSV